ncbi:MAG: tyrosine-type recombinase/integrase [Candidatus Eremiobacteraeota bacterium]|nr:tyrosine-type recombinase/integrase [Candidatus Eremiobacteraeota bacterium]
MNEIKSGEIEEVINYLEESANPRHRIWILLALYSGMRRTEIAKLKWSDIGKGRKKIKKKFVHHQAKKNSKMKITLGERVKKLLSVALQRRRRKHYCFKGNGNRTHICPETVYRAWARMQLKIWGEKRYTLHELRHTGISRKWWDTLSVKKTKEFARHKDFETTMRYIH